MTKDKKIKFLKTKNNIIVFKEPFKPNGKHFENPTQEIIVFKLKYATQKQGRSVVNTKQVRIEGRVSDSKWYDTIEDLISAVNWTKTQNHK